LKDDPLPDWPTPASEPIGEDRARAYIAGIRDHVAPCLKEAPQLLHARYPDAMVEQSRVRVQGLATWHPPTERMPRFKIGVVSASVSGGSWAMVDILITHDGRLAVSPGVCASRNDISILQHGGSTVNEQQLRTYSTALGEQYNVERNDAEILLRRLSQHAHSFEIIGYAVSLLGQGVAIQTLIDAAANLGAVSEQLALFDK
jgi:hypothetical protein